MNQTAFFLSIVLILASGFVPAFVGQKLGPGRGLAVGIFGVLVVLGSVFASGSLSPGTFDLVALGFLAQGMFVNYRRYAEASVIERGEAAIAAAEAQRK